MKRSPLLLRKTKLVSVNLNCRNHRTFLPVLPLLDELDESCVSAGGDLFVCYDDWGPYVKEN